MSPLLLKELIIIFLFQYVLIFNMLLTSIHTVPPYLNTEQPRLSLGGGLYNEKRVTDDDFLACPGILRGSSIRLEHRSGSMLVDE